MLSIIIAPTNLQWKTNGGLLRSHFTTCMNRAHLVQAQHSTKWSAIYVFYWNYSYVFHMNILFEVYHIFISTGDFARMVSRVAFLLMSLTLVRFEMALSTCSVFIAFLIAFYWGTPLGVPQYWFDQTWGKRAIIEGDNFFFINREVALSGRIWSELPDSNADGCF